MTSTKMNTMVPEWNESSEAVVSRGGELDIILWDRDTAAHDEIARCTVELTPEVLRARFGLCENDSTSISVGWFPIGG